MHESFAQSKINTNTKVQMGQTVDEMLSKTKEEIKVCTYVNENA